MQDSDASGSPPPVADELALDDDPVPLAGVVLGVNLSDKVPD